MENLQWQQILGHKDNIDILQNFLQSGRMPHAFLFAGPAGIGKFLMARLVAAELLCENVSHICGVCRSCKAMAAGNHPDCHIVSPAGQTIKIEQVRKLQSEIALTASYGGWRAAIVNDAELLNEQSANSMLKILEEPPEKVIFILVTANRQSMLNTIISRCVTLNFQPMARRDIIACLIKRGVAEDKSATLAALADGSIGQALRFNTAKLEELVELAWQVFDHLLAWQAPDIWRWSDKLSGYGREDILDFIALFNMLLRDMLVFGCAGEAVELYYPGRIRQFSRYLTGWSDYKLRAVMAETVKFGDMVRANGNIKMAANRWLINAAAC